MVALVVVSGLATATPLTPQQASDFKQGATASCVKSMTAQTGKRFTTTQIKSYCSCHAGKLATSLSLEDL